MDVGEAGAKNRLWSSRVRLARQPTAERSQHANVTIILDFQTFFIILKVSNPPAEDQDQSRYIQRRAPPMALFHSLSFEAAPRSLSATLGRLDIHGCLTDRHLRWAWLALVKDGPSVELIAGPIEVTVAWGSMRHSDPAARVWAWRRRHSAASDEPEAVSLATEDAAPATPDPRDDGGAQRPHLTVIEGGRTLGTEGAQRSRTNTVARPIARRALGPLAR